MHLVAASILATPQFRAIFHKNPVGECVENVYCYVALLVGFVTTHYGKMKGKGV